MNRKRAYLQAMGIPVWKPRRTLPFAKQGNEVLSGMITANKNLASEFSSTDTSVSEEGSSETDSSEALVDQSSHSMRPLAEQSNAQKQITDPTTADMVTSQHIEKLPNTEVAQPIDWELLKQQVSQCTACELHLSRNKPVFGVGNIHADWMIIGEAPGADEDARGEPFVGRAGKLLDQMLLAIGVSRQEVFIANILKCRPPNNRDPKAEEVACCSSFLTQQIRSIKPKVILAVGRIAAQNLLQSKETIGKLRGKVFRFDETSTPLVATYHPAYLLRSPSEKSKAWSDLVLAKQVSAR